MTQISDLVDEICNLNIEKGWRENATGAQEGYEFPAYIALAHTELSEALEAYRDKVWSSEVDDNHGGAKPVGVGPELADVIIRIFDMCGIWDIDIEAELARVIAYGWTRPYQHGGRKL